MATRSRIAPCTMMPAQPFSTAEAAMRSPTREDSSEPPPSITSTRSVLAMVSGSTPPSRERLQALVKRSGQPLRSFIRDKGTPYDDLGLGDPALSDEQLLDAMLEHPILINRPIVETPKGTRLCRPSERVLDLLGTPVASFVKEDGEMVRAVGAADASR